MRLPFLSVVLLALKSEKKPIQIVHEPLLLKQTSKNNTLLEFFFRNCQYLKRKRSVYNHYLNLSTKSSWKQSKRLSHKITVNHSRLKFPATFWPFFFLFGLVNRGYWLWGGVFCSFLSNFKISKLLREFLYNTAFHYLSCRMRIRVFPNWTIFCNFVLGVGTLKNTSKPVRLRTV